MIVVNARFETDEATIDAMKAAIAKMEQASQAEEGCQDYTFSVELNDPTVMRITELWDDMAALEAHFQTPHMAEFQQAMAAHPPKAVDAKFFEASIVDGPGR